MIIASADACGLLPTFANFVCLTLTSHQLLNTSLWGRPDPSVEMHPLSIWHLWFRATEPMWSYAPILLPAELQHVTQTARPIPYSLPLYVYSLLGPEALQKERYLVTNASLLVNAGLKIKPPPPCPSLFSDLGPWQGLEISTVLQAHNLRHCAVSNGDIYAV